MHEKFLEFVEGRFWICLISATIATIWMLLWSADLLSDKLQEVTTSVFWLAIGIIIMLWWFVLDISSTKIASFCIGLSVKLKVRYMKNVEELQLLARYLESYPEYDESRSTNASKRLIELGVLEYMPIMPFQLYSNGEVVDNLRLNERYYKCVKKRVSKIK